MTKEKQYLQRRKDDLFYKPIVPLILLVTCLVSSTASEMASGECKTALPPDAFVTLKNGQRLCRVITGSDALIFVSAYHFRPG